MIQSAFWNAFFEGLATPAYWALRGTARRDEPDELPPLSADTIQFLPPELLVETPGGSIQADMAAVYGDFLRALDRTK